MQQELKRKGYGEQLEPIQSRGAKSGRWHMRDDQVTWNERRVTFQNNTESIEKKNLTAVWQTADQEGELCSNYSIYSDLAQNETYWKFTDHIGSWKRHLSNNHCAEGKRRISKFTNVDVAA